MKYTGCSSCFTKNIPINETKKVDGNIYCYSCFKANFPDQKHLKGKQIQKNFDPTICASCGKDFEDKVLNKISDYPLCDDCEANIKNKSLPKWVIAFFALILLLVAFSFIYNWRFYQSYMSIKDMNSAVQKGDIEGALAAVRNASDKVPEADELRVLCYYYNGLSLLSKDKCTEALEEFNKCYQLPPDFGVSVFITKATIGSSFEKKDYDTFLAASLDNLALDSSQAVAWASVASAYACVYAVKGKDSIKTLALKYLDRARSIDRITKDMNDYYNMIEYRIYTKDIIPKEDFYKKYPNGWTKNGSI